MNYLLVLDSAMAEYEGDPAPSTQRRIKMYFSIVSLFCVFVLFCFHVVSAARSVASTQRDARPGPPLLPRAGAAVPKPSLSQTCTPVKPQTRAHLVSGPLENLSTAKYRSLFSSPFSPLLSGNSPMFPEWGLAPQFGNRSSRPHGALLLLLL